MAGGVVLQGTADVSRVEAPVTVKAYLICAFAAFGGIFFGYDTGTFFLVFSPTYHFFGALTNSHRLDGWCSRLALLHHSLYWI
jgi:hypothetical protein